MMEKRLENLLRKFLQDKQKRNKWLKIVAVLASFVVFVTVYALILPGSAWTGEKAETTTAVKEATAGAYGPESKKEEKKEEEETEEKTTVAKAETESDTSKIDKAETKTTEQKEQAEGQTEEKKETGEQEEKTKEEKKEEAKEAEPAGKEEDYKAGKLTYEGTDYIITAEYGKEAKIPEGAKLAVKKIKKTDEKYQDYYDSALKELKKQNASETITSADFFDISFKSGEKEIEPRAKVTVTIKYNDKTIDVKGNKTVETIHFDRRKEEKPEILKETKTEGKKTDTVDEITFKSDRFSVYGVVGTETLEKDILTADGKNYKVTVNYGEEAGIPEGAELVVEEVGKKSEKYDNYLRQTAEAIHTDVESLDYIKLLDISIVKDGKKIQPDASVNVKISLLDKEKVEENAKVVHFGKKGIETLGAKVNRDTVSFKTSGFSIYAITESTKRLVYEFYNGTKLLATEYVKSKDELYDPGLTVQYGQKFIGWAYENNATEGKTIEDIQTDAASKLNDPSVVDGTTVKVYAIFTEAYYLRYMIIDSDGKTVVWATESVTKDATDKTLRIRNDRPDLEEGMTFSGWVDGDTGKVYQANEQITLDHNMDLYIKVEGRYWLVFDSNTNGSSEETTYIPPQLVFGENATTTKPDDPERRGYSFIGWNTKADGTGNWWYKADGTDNQFGGQLTSDVTLYAQWEPEQTQYYVIYWKQKATDTVGLSDDEKSYDYVSSEERTAETGATVTLKTEDKQKGGAIGSDYGYYFTYNDNNSDESETVSADGKTVLNVYYDRREITYQFDTGTNEYTEEKYGPYGLVDGGYVQLYYKNGRSYNKVVDNDSHDTVYYISSYFWEQPIYSQYNNGTRYKKNYLTFTGLYGSAFTQWPDPGDGKVWYANDVNFPLALTEFNPKAAYKGNSDNVTDTTITFTKKNYQTSNNLYVYVQTEDGKWSYENKYLLATAKLQSSGTWYPTETFTGFEVDSYQEGSRLSANGTWSSISSSGSIDYNRQNIYLRYRRNKHNIHFISTGAGASGRTEETVQGVYYEKELGQYGLNEESGNWYYMPNNGKDGYEFMGWYLDEACLVPFDFSKEKMPDHNITLYAKWEKTQIRVFLVPTPNHEKDAEVSFANNQELTFLTDYNEKVSGENITGNAAQRLGYSLSGWYTSPEFNSSTLWNFDTQLNRSSPGVDMNYQSTDDWSKYGDNDGKHNNVKGILKLYAKWDLSINENAIYIEYKIPEDYLVYSGGVLQTNVPVDSTAYVIQQDGTTQTAKIMQAPTDYDSNYTFSNWVLLDKNGNKTEVTKLPGESWDIDKNCIEERQITGTIINDEGEEETVTRTMKVVTFLGSFNLKQEKSTTITYMGNGGTTNGGETEIKKTLLINEGFTLLDSTNSFTRPGYKLIGWSFEPPSNETESLFENIPEPNKGIVKDKDGNHIGYAPGLNVAADNKDIPLYNDKGNTLYAVWKALPWTVTVNQVIEGEDNSTKQFNYNFTSGIDDGDGFILVGTTIEATRKVFNNILAGTSLTLPVPSVDEDYELVSVKVNDKVTPSGIESYVVTGDTDIVFTYKVKPRKAIVIKKQSSSQSLYLDGAVFKLYKVKSGSPDTIVTDQKVNETLTAEGEFTISNGETGITLSLKYGDYKISEVKCPDGYIMKSADTFFTVDENGVHMTTTTDSEGKATPITAPSDAKIVDQNLVVYNTPGEALPSTGGSGTTLYTLGGLSMITFALMAGFVLRRKREGRFDG